MPFETEAQAAERKAKKAEQSRALFARQQELQRAVEERLLLNLSAQYIRGYDELAALLRVSARAAVDVSKQPGFPRPKNPLGDRVKLWRTDAVIQWIDAQEADQ
jgi:hypothetical protein